MTFIIAGEAFEALPGDVRHSVDVLDDCVVIEVFSPARKDYLP
jgi:hypothetical protein